MMIFTVKDKVVECLIVVVGEQNIILNRSAHNPAHAVSEDASAQCNR